MRPVPGSASVGMQLISSIGIASTTADSVLFSFFL